MPRFIIYAKTLVVCALAICFLSLSAFAQNDLGRQTVAITYPLDQTIKVQFRGTTRLPRLKGEAKVKRSGRRNTRVELSIENLPRAYELGEPYTTYVLWAVAPDGRVDNLGEIKRSGSAIFDTKIDVTTPLQTFALIVTAEPHFLMRAPSRQVVLENLAPINPKDAQAATVDVKYIGNTSDYFDSGKVPEIADRDYSKTPVSLLGARQAVQLARYAGAGRDAEEELKQAADELERAENALRAKQTEAEIDALSRNVTSLGARAEETALSRRAARERREERLRRDADMREVERTATDASEELARLKTQLETERKDKELMERDVANLSEQLREARTEVARLREEIQTERQSGEEARLKLARLEGERQALATTETNRNQVQQEQQLTATFRTELARFGLLADTPRGMILTLPDSYFAGARSAQLTASASNTLTQIANLLASNPNYSVTIESYADSRGTPAQLQQLTDQRAQSILAMLTQAGVSNTRLQAAGKGASNPVAANSSLASRARNRRVEITFAPQSVSAN